jgi:hypothetical protein
MNQRVYARRMGLPVGLAVAVMLTGCAAIQRSEARSTEELLAAAGFVMRPADTAERQQHLAALTPYRLESRTKDGKAVYTYADPGGCKCLYVGGSKEYSEYQRLRVQRQIAEDQAWAAQEAQMDSSMWWGPWGPW